MGQVVLDIMYLWVFIFMRWRSIKKRRKISQIAYPVHWLSESKAKDERLKSCFPKIHINVLPNEGLIILMLSVIHALLFSDKCLVHGEADTHRSHLKISNRYKLFFLNFLYWKKKKKEIPSELLVSISATDNTQKGAPLEYCSLKLKTVL